MSPTPAAASAAALPYGGRCDERHRGHEQASEDDEPGDAGGVAAFGPNATDDQSQQRHRSVRGGGEHGGVGHVEMEPRLSSRGR